jgi:hypothetical protein
MPLQSRLGWLLGWREFTVIPWWGAMDTSLVSVVSSSLPVPLPPLLSHFIFNGLDLMTDWHFPSGYHILLWACSVSRILRTLCAKLEKFLLQIFSRTEMAKGEYAALLGYMHAYYKHIIKRIEER